MARIRADFPILAPQVHGKPLVYLDNAATTQKPQAVLDAIVAYYTGINANVHRGVHELSDRATDALRGGARAASAASSTPPRRARSSSRATPPRASTSWRTAFGQAAAAAGRRSAHLGDGAPFQHRALADRSARRPARGCGVVPIDDAGELLTRRVRAAARPAHPHRRRHARVERARARSTRSPTSSRSPTGTACRCCSTRRRRRPTCASTCRRSTATSSSSPATSSTARPASACSTARQSCLEAMPPFQGGGDMISSVTFEKTTWNALPYKFEAGTPDIAGAIGLDAALDYIDGVGLGRDRRARARADCVYATRACSSDRRRPHHRHGAATSRASCRSSSTASTRTTSARLSIAKASPSAPAITARSR